MSEIIKSMVMYRDSKYSPFKNAFCKMIELGGDKLHLESGFFQKDILNHKDDEIPTTLLNIIMENIHSEIIIKGIYGDIPPTDEFLKQISYDEDKLYWYRMYEGFKSEISKTGLAITETLGTNRHSKLYAVKNDKDEIIASILGSTNLTQKATGFFDFNRNKGPYYNFETDIVIWKNQDIHYTYWIGIDPDDFQKYEHKNNYTPIREDNDDSINSNKKLKLLEDYILKSNGEICTEENVDDSLLVKNKSNRKVAIREKMHRLLKNRGYKKKHNSEIVLQSDLDEKKLSGDYDEKKDEKGLKYFSGRG